MNALKAYMIRAPQGLQVINIQKNSPDSNKLQLGRVRALAQILVTIICVDLPFVFARRLIKQLICNL
jgi:hypothetical protein